MLWERRQSPFKTLSCTTELTKKIARQSEQIKQQNVSLRADCAVDAVRQGKQQFHSKKSDSGRSRSMVSIKTLLHVLAVLDHMEKNNPAQLRIRGAESVPKLDISKQPVKQKC